MMEVRRQKSEISRIDLRFFFLLTPLCSFLFARLTCCRQPLRIGFVILSAENAPLRIGLQELGAFLFNPLQHRGDLFAFIANRRQNAIVDVQWRPTAGQHPPKSPDRPTSLSGWAGYHVACSSEIDTPG